MEHAWEFACRSASATPATKYDSNQCCNGFEAEHLISLAGATAMAGMMEHLVFVIVCVCVCELFLFHNKTAFAAAVKLDITL